DAGVAVDRTNYPNMYSSYYPYGGAIALALDLTLRTKYKLTLDDYMTGLWKRFGKPEIAYTVQGLEDVLAEVTSDKTFAADFFSRYINGHESFNYTPLLEKAGLTLKKQYAGKAWLGNVQYAENTTIISSNTIIGTPLYNAGLDVEDAITQLDGKLVARAADINEVLSSHKPGDAISIQYKHRKETKNATITLGENPAYSLTTYEQAGLTLTNEMKEFRSNWLGTKVK
ncbi:MAG TPA: PDZ domain-containing protein, partial [Niastella sp.]